MTTKPAALDGSEARAKTIWTLHLDAIYEWSGTDVRRVTGCEAPTKRQGPDGTWQPYRRLLVAGPSGWRGVPHAVPQLLGRSYAVDWNGRGEHTALSTVVAASSTPLWGRSFWCRPSASEGLWEIVAANATVAVAPTPNAALVIAALAQRGPAVTSAALGARTAATPADLPAVGEWRAVDSSPHFESSPDGWTRPWPVSVEGHP